MSFSWPWGRGHCGTPGCYALAVETPLSQQEPSRSAEGVGGAVSATPHLRAGGTAEYYFVLREAELPAILLVALYALTF